MATRRRRSQKPPSAPAPAEHPPAGTGSGLGFFEIMRRVTELLASPDDSSTLPDLAKKLRKSSRTVLAKAEGPGPLPPSERKRFEALVNMIDDLAASDFSALCALFGHLEQLRIVHPILVFLMQDNFQYLDHTFGRVVAQRAFTDVFKSMVPPRKRGRPRQISMETVQKMKALSDTKQNYAQIARQVRLTPTQVRSTLEHYYPKR